MMGLEARGAGEHHGRAMTELPFLFVASSRAVLRSRADLVT
jgi:hypothetical protein